MADLPRSGPEARISGQTRTGPDRPDLPDMARMARILPGFLSGSPAPGENPDYRWGPDISRITAGARIFPGLWTWGWEWGGMRCVVRCLVLVPGACVRLGLFDVCVIVITECN